MRMGAVEQRLGALLERDWKTEATALLAERQKSGEGTVCRSSLSSSDTC